MKTKRKAYLVYRPVMDYEESEVPYFVCATQERADAAVMKIRTFMCKLVAKLPRHDHTAPLEKQERNWVLRDKIVAEAKWPFGVEMVGDALSSFYNGYDPSSVAVQELPFCE